MLVYEKVPIIMDQKAVFKLCKELGCCDGCGLRFLGIRDPEAYNNIKQFSLQFQETDSTNAPAESDKPSTVPNDNPSSNGNATIENVANSDTAAAPNVSIESCVNGTEPERNGEVNGDSPPAKRRKTDVCTSCLGILQEDGWPDCNSMVKEMLDKKKYDCVNFACALSSPIAILLREKAIWLRLSSEFPDYDANIITALKEAWKWSYGVQLARLLALTLDSGAVSPLLVTVNMEYPDDLQELEVLKQFTPGHFVNRNRQKHRFAVEFTRRSVEQALEGATRARFETVAAWARGPPASGARAACVSVAGCRAPTYLGGRYVKLSRTLPQTPWIVGGKRVMDSSVQELIFGPIARVQGMSEAEAEHRLKFMSAGREDVDVRCLGDGRPFAIEITDPRRELTSEELRAVCEEVSAGGQVELKRLVYVTREHLTQLKMGEETKCKTYEALCIKLTPSVGSEHLPTPDSLTVSDADIARLNSFGSQPVTLQQRTPIRVLHRRPLLTRTRNVLELHAEKVPGHPRLFGLRIRTSAGAYVKEFVHGELGRTTPSLAAAGAGRADILALDVSCVHLDWPNI